MPSDQKTKMNETIYVTKYALTAGIQKLSAEVKEDGYAVIRPQGWMSILGKNDWRPTLEAAQVRAEEMRAARLASLRKSIAKLEKQLIKVLDVPA